MDFVAFSLVRGGSAAMPVASTEKTGLGAEGAGQGEWLFGHTYTWRSNLSVVEYVSLR